MNKKLQSSMAHYSKLAPGKVIKPGAALKKNFKTYRFKTYQDLEKYFLNKILPQKNISSKVIGKTLFVWKKQRKAA
tara:strand:- start:3 stop:230 length:228 start_codon:yes stop_codon:yes gene_type:complete